MNRILIVVLVLVLAIGGYALWSRSHPGSSFGDGSVKSTDGTSTDKAMNTGATTELDGKESIDSVKPHALSQRRAWHHQRRACHSGRFRQTRRLQDNPLPTPRSRASVLRHATPISPNPPNGAVFTASGKYQWYRQGTSRGA